MEAVSGRRQRGVAVPKHGLAPVIIIQLLGLFRPVQGREQRLGRRGFQVGQVGVGEAGRQLQHLVPRCQPFHLQLHQALLPGRDHHLGPRLVKRHRLAGQAVLAKRAHQLPLHAPPRQPQRVEMGGREGGMDRLAIGQVPDLRAARVAERAQSPGHCRAGCLPPLLLLARLARLLGGAAGGLRCRAPHYQLQHREGQAVGGAGRLLLQSPRQLQRGGRAGRRAGIWCNA